MPCHLSQVLWVLEHDYRGILCVCVCVRACVCVRVCVCVSKACTLFYSWTTYWNSNLLVFLTCVRDSNGLKSALKDRCHHVTLQSKLLSGDGEISQWSPALLMRDGRSATCHTDFFLSSIIPSLSTCKLFSMCVCVCVCVQGHPCVIEGWDGASGICISNSLLPGYYAVVTHPTGLF